MRSVSVSLVAVCGCMWLMAACGPKHDDGGADAGDGTDAGATCPDNAHAGQQVTVGDITGSLMTLTPAPAEKGDNTWTVKLQSSGADVTGATVTFEPFMPAHGHGTTPPSFTATENAGAEYHAGPFNLFMPGTWDVKVRVTRTGMTDIVLTFHACIAG